MSGCSLLDLVSDIMASSLIVVGFPLESMTSASVSERLTELVVVPVICIQLEEHIVVLAFFVILIHKFITHTIFHVQSHFGAIVTHVGRVGASKMYVIFIIRDVALSIV